MYPNRLGVLLVIRIPLSGKNMTKNNLLAFTFFLLILSIIINGCAGKKPRVSPQPDQVEQVAADLQRKKAELEQKTVEILDLKSNIIIMQSEIIDLKNEIMRLKKVNADLQEKLAKKDYEVEILQSQVMTLEKEKQEISIEQQKLKEAVEKARQDSIKRIQMLAENVSRPADSTISEAGEPDSTKPTASPPEESPELPALKITPEEFRMRYNEALDIYFQGKYKEAIKNFTSLIQLDRNNSFSDNCQYWVAESYYSMEQYNKAIEEFKKVFDFPDDNKYDHAQFKIALSYFKLGNKKKAAEEFRKLIETFPNSELVSKVKQFMVSNKF
jgi:TolA-binding protein